MKHPSIREFFAYWDARRGHARAPDRCDIDPHALRSLLGDIFVLSYDQPAGYPFRVAGTRTCALLGGDLKDRSFPGLFDAASRADLEEIVAAVAEELIVAVAGVTAAGEDGTATHFELLLLPFSQRAHAPVSLTGMLAPFETRTSQVGELRLTSWRYVQQQQKIVPRTLRKLALARGLMVYEGLR